MKRSHLLWPWLIGAAFASRERDEPNVSALPGLAKDPDYLRRLKADEENRAKHPSRKQRLKAKNRRRKP